MSQQVTINSVTANTPVEIYYCDSMSASCVYVATVSVFPYTFEVPSPYDSENIVIKIIDTQSCVDGQIIYITPTATPQPTITPTQTSTTTPTNTPTTTNTPSITPSNTSTPTYTPTNTPTPTTTPVVAYHTIGNILSVSSASTCSDMMTVTNYFTYISQSNLTPVIGAVVYQTLLNGTLYNPLNGTNRYLKMGFGNDFYIVQINSSGSIIDFGICP
jgi:cell division septation protein DedD